MAFDDLARHLAARDGKKVPVGSADQIVAEAEKVSRRMGRTRDVILGVLLLVGGLAILGFYALTLLDVFNSTPSPLRPPSGTMRMRIPIYISVAGVGAVIVGLRKLIRGLAGRSR